MMMMMMMMLDPAVPGGNFTFTCGHIGSRVLALRQRVMTHHDDAIFFSYPALQTGHRVVLPRASSNASKHAMQSAKQK